MTDVKRQDIMTGMTYLFQKIKIFSWNCKYKNFYNTVYIHQICLSIFLNLVCTTVKVLLWVILSVIVWSLEVPQLLDVTNQLLWQSQLWHYVHTALQQQVQISMWARGAVSGLWEKILRLLRPIHDLFLSTPTAVRLVATLSTAAWICLFHLQILHALRDVAHTRRGILQSLHDAVHDLVFVLCYLLQEVGHRGWDRLFWVMDLAPAPYSAVGGDTKRQQCYIQQYREPTRAGF